MEDVMTRVERGAEWLDQVQPGWIDKIALQRLRLSDCMSCVLGQVFGTFQKGLISAHRFELFDSWRWAEHHAFERRISESESYTDLGRAWKAYILARRASQNLSAPQPQHQDEGELVGV